MLDNINVYQKKANLIIFIRLISILSLILCIKSDIYNNNNLKANSPILESSYSQENENDIHCTIEQYFLKNCALSFTKDEEKFLFKKNVFKMISNHSLDKLINKLYQENYENYLRKESEESYILSSITNQHIEGENITVLDFSKCLVPSFERQYGIFKIEHKLESYKIPIIEYKTFNYEEGFVSFKNCIDKKIYYNIPLDIDINEDNIYLYNESSEYYKDECGNYKSENDTDMSLYTRRNNFNEKYYLCESHCIFKGYNAELKQVICECNYQYKDGFLSEEDLYIGNLVYQMKNEEKITNFEVMKCSYLITSADDIKKNPGFYIPLFGLILLFFIMILFCFKGYNNLSQRIDEAIKAKFHENKYTTENKNKLIIFTVKKNNINSITHIDNYNDSGNKIDKKKKKKSLKVEGKRKKNSKSRINSKSLSMNSKNSLISHLKKNKKISTNILNSNTTINDIIDKNIYVFENDFEIDMTSFETALKCDKRTCCEYYSSLIRNKQLILYSFCDYNSYNSSIVKKIIFFLSFIYHYGINAFFFIDSTLHQIYLDEGKYNILLQFPNSVYSAIVSTGLIRLLILLIDTEQNILEIKNQKNENISIMKKKGLMKKIIIKFLLFFIINILLLIFFWYYLTCFNAVYINIKVTHCINTLFSFALSNIFSFLYYIIPAFFRRDIIKNKTQTNKAKKSKQFTKSELEDAEYIYKLSQHLENFL